MTLWVFYRFYVVLASTVLWNGAETEFVTVPSEFCDFQAMTATSVSVIDIVIVASCRRFPARRGESGRVQPCSTGFGGDYRSAAPISVSHHAPPSSTDPASPGVGLV